MEVIADFLMEILPTSIGDWLSEHLFVRMRRKIKSKPLRLLISLLVCLVVFSIGVGIALLCIIGLIMFLN
ncbi:MAG: hypothetical protein E7466_00090 [Ruminococcaceae bacterium]|nr:hypothetical protein [Oscillospiraceae bacterium]